MDNLLNYIVVGVLIIMVIVIAVCEIVT